MHAIIDRIRVFPIVSMLHAFARRKSSAYKRYLRVREHLEPRVSSEDEITSLIFGPLEFLSAADNWTLWKLLLACRASSDRSGPLPADFFCDFFPSSCTLEFWPRRDYIEPDLVVLFANERGETRSLLVELKWDAGPSGQDQLEKQWLQFQRGQHANSLHVFLAKHMDYQPADRKIWAGPNEDDMATSRLRSIRWHEFRHEIRKPAGLQDTSEPFKRWCELVSVFLDKVDIRPFIGFSEAVALANAIPCDAHEDIRFWNGTSP